MRKRLYKIWDKNNKQIRTIKKDFKGTTTKTQAFCDIHAYFLKY